MSLFFQKIDLLNPPQETVLAANIKETSKGWRFIDDPIVGQIRINGGKAYCVVPFFDSDDQSWYRELVTHFIEVSDLEKKMGALDE